MATYKKAAEILAEAVKDPGNKKKVARAKKNPRLKSIMNKLTADDLETLKKVAQGGGVVKCTDQ
jgi:hypothetical protein